MSKNKRPLPLTLLKLVSLSYITSIFNISQILSLFYVCVHNIPIKILYSSWKMLNWVWTVLLPFGILIFIGQDNWCRGSIIHMHNGEQQRGLCLYLRNLFNSEDVAFTKSTNYFLLLDQKIKLIPFKKKLKKLLM